MNIFWAFFRRDLLYQVSYRFSFLLQLLQIVPAVLMFFFLSRLVDANAIAGPLTPYGGAYFPFVLIGIAFQNYFTMAMHNFSASIRESQLSGTLEAVFVTPVGLPQFLIGSTAYSFFFNSVRILLYLGFGFLLLEAGFAWRQVPAGLLAILFSIGAFSSLGIFSAAFILLFKKGDPVNWLFNVLSWLLGGVYYPVSILPEWMRHFAAFIPMTHALESFRMAVIGGRPIADILPHLLPLAAWTIIGLPISFLSFRYALNRCRENGTLSHY